MKFPLKWAGVICLVLTLCLAALATGYSQWNENLNISGTVMTGSVGSPGEPNCLGFIQVATNDPPGSYDLDTDGDGISDLDVGCTSATLSDTDGDTDLDLCTVTLTNVYPCYTGKVFLTIKNLGTNDVHVAAVNIDNPNPAAISVSWIDGECNIIEISEEDEGKVQIHVEDDSAELTSYTFTVEIVPEAA